MANRVIAKFDATIQRNCAWARALVFLNDDGSPFNLTGITLTGQMRNGAASENPPLANVTFTTASPSSGATVVSLSAHDTGLLPEGGSKFESLTTVVMEIDGAHISDPNNPFRMAEGAIGISSGGNSILPQSSAPTVPLETINLIVGAVSASSARAMLGLDDGTGKIPGSLLAPASVSSPGSVPNIGGPSGVATLGPDGLQPVAEMRSATASSPGAAPKWAFSAVPRTYTALGDSITEIAGSFAYRLATKLGCTLTNLAVGGTVVCPHAPNAHISDQVTTMVAGNAPDLITWCCGPNDFGLGNTLGIVDDVMAKSFAALNETLSFAEAVRYNLERIVTAFPSSRLVVVEMLQSTQYDGYDYQFCDTQNVIAKNMSIEVIPARTSSGLWANNAQLWTDAIHPNALGCEILATYVQRFLVG